MGVGSPHEMVVRRTILGVDSPHEMVVRTKEKEDEEKEEEPCTARTWQELGKGRYKLNSKNLANSVTCRYTPRRRRQRRRRRKRRRTNQSTCSFARLLFCCFALCALGRYTQIKTYPVTLQDFHQPWVQATAARRRKTACIRTLVELTLRTVDALMVQ